MTTKTIPEVDLEALLAHAGWLRRLAAHLVRDPAAREDAVQETFAAALRSPPDPGRPARPWLAEVLRNFVRSRRRAEARARARHEALAHTVETEAPSPAQIAERSEMQRLVAELVAALDEPYRTALWLRYYEQKEPTEIARELGVPAGTIRWRVSEGLGRLRTRLDARAGSRRAWMAALVPLAAPPPSAAILLGAKAKAALVAGGAAAVLVSAVALRHPTTGQEGAGLPPQLTATRSLPTEPGGVGRAPAAPRSSGAGQTEARRPPPPRFLAPARRAAEAPAEPGRGAGAADKAVIRTVIRGRMQAVKACYEEQLLRDPGTSGRLRTQFTIQEKDGVGRVTHATIVPSAGQSEADAGRTPDGEQNEETGEITAPAMELCILRALAEAEFPIPERGGIVTVTYPFQFTASGDAPQRGREGPPPSR